jgi:ElaB/YqjD/DUF883 family membrane-anchored ribosome-binding protein
MKRTTPMAASLALAAAMLVGCEQKQEDTTAPAAPTAAERQAADTVDRVTAPVTGAGAAATDAAKDTSAAAKDAAAGTADEVKDALGGTTDAIKKQADDLITQARTFITEKKLNEAQGIVEQLRTLRAQLPADYQAKVDEVIKLYDSAKGAAGAIPGNLPGMGGGGAK